MRLEENQSLHSSPFSSGIGAELVWWSPNATRRTNIVLETVVVALVEVPQYLVTVQMINFLHEKEHLVIWMAPWRFGSCDPHGI